MAELRKMHLTISKGMKLSCTVEQASEDVIVVSLKHKTKEYRGVLLDSSERRLPAGLCFNSDNGTTKPDGENAGSSGADGVDPTQPKEVKGVTLDCRYSYNNDPAKYNEQPLPTTSAISIRPARGKQVRNIRLRPRQTLCSKCKAAIHDSKSKSPNKFPKPDGQEQESHPHNTRYRAALSSKPNDTPNTPPGPTLRSGSRNKRSESTPKVLLENIRPKREVKPTAKKREADAAQRSRLAEASAKKNNVLEERTSDTSAGSGASRHDMNKTVEQLTNDRKEDENSRVMLERSVSIDNPTALGQYNKQPVVRLDKSAVNNMNIRTEVKEEKQEKAPTISIVNIRSTPAIKISYGAGDRDVLKIPPRLPGADMKSPDDHSTADESPAPVTPPHPPSPPQKKTKKASRRTRDKQKQRYRIINDGDAAASEVHAPGIKITGYHRKHKRKHKHRHASSEDENFNSEADIPPPAKLPAIITKLSVVPSNDLNGNEKKGDSEVLKDSSNETPTRQEEFVDHVAKSPFDISDSVNSVRRNETQIDFGFDDDPLKLKTEDTDTMAEDIKLDPPSPSQVNQREDLLDQSETATSESLPVKLDVKPFEMWGSPVGTPAFETEGSPTHIEAPPFQSDDSQDGLIVGPLRMGSSPTKDENLSSFDSVPTSPPQAAEDREEAEPSLEEEKKEPVPYGVGMFEDLTPDEDEDDHDDNNVSQPMYQLPKKPRLSMYSGWSNDGLSASSHVPGYLSKKAEDPASLYSNQSGVYQNGPSSFFSPGPSSLYTGNSSNFPSSPAPRIQNSPTPIIQRSPVSIFNYSASRYQSSPNRRFGSSPSRRFHSMGDSGSRQQSVIAGNLNHSRYQGHDVDRFQTTRESISNISSGYHAQSQSHSESDASHSSSSNRYPSKFDSQASFRYQPSNEKSGASRYPSQSQSGGSAVSRLPSTEESSFTTPKSQESVERTSDIQYVWSSGDSGSLPRFAIPSNGSSSVSQYTGQGGTSLLPHYSAHSVDGSLPNQYPSLGSTEARFQTLSESPFKTHSTANVPSPLSLQKNSRSVSSLGSSSVYAEEKERKSVLSAPQYETVDASALFMTHPHIQTPASSSENVSVPRFLNKPLSSSVASQNPVARLQSTDSAKAIGVFTGSPESNASVSMYHQNKVLSGTGSGSQGRLLLGQEQSGSSLTRHPSSSSLSQGNSVSISDSEDDSDNAVPGFVPTTSGVLASDSLSQDVSHTVSMMKLGSQNMSSCVGEDGREIRVGSVQWGKVQGFPWWPCRVLLIKLAHRDHREQTPIIRQVCHVSWFGSRTVSDLHPSELRPFREEFSKRHVKKKRGPYYMAIQQAWDATDTPSLPSMDITSVPAQQHLTLNMQDLVS
ncbi:uncharacterized protein LOC143278583 [Babylonia areolata]|uniref:uncharacterized protein LOC143278583 n=1 Tax=Babylonia areolata TaxID=304850 RepID=UPI003FD0C2C9